MIFQPAAGLVEIVEQPRAARAGGAGDNGGAADRDGRAELVAGGLAFAVGGRQLRRLRGRRPAAAALHENVGGAELGVHERRSDHGHAPVRGDFEAEVVAADTVRRGQLRRLCLVRPAAARLDELVRRARPSCAVGRARGDARSVGRDRAAEQVVGGAVGGGQLRRLRPGRPTAARLYEHVHGALLRVAADGRVRRAGRDRVAADRDASAEVVDERPVRRGQLRRLRGRRPAAGRLHEHVDGALIDVRADLGPDGPGDDRVSVDRDAPAEAVILRAVGRRQPGRLGCVGPTAARLPNTYTAPWLVCPFTGAPLEPTAIVSPLTATLIPRYWLLPLLEAVSSALWTIGSIRTG